jgi:hypothetical protein
MTYLGPRQFRAQLSPDGRYSATLSCVVAAEDTSAIIVTLVCSQCDQSVAQTIIMTDDTVRILDYLPTPHGPDRPVEQKVVDHTATGPKPERRARVHLSAADSAELLRQPTAEELRDRERESRLEQMREMEKEPLSDYEAQVFTVDTIDYIRYRGETRFHPAVPVKDPWEFSRHMADSIREQWEAAGFGANWEYRLRLFRGGNHEKVLGWGLCSIGGDGPVCRSSVEFAAHEIRVCRLQTRTSDTTPKRRCCRPNLQFQDEA